MALSLRAILLFALSTLDTYFLNFSAVRLFFIFFHFIRIEYITVNTLVLCAHHTEFEL